MRPHHVQLIELAHKYGKPVMYHTDDAIRQMLPELIDMGVDLLNPLQPDAKDMDLGAIKTEFSGKLAFHGHPTTARPNQRGPTPKVGSSRASLTPTGATPTFTWSPKAARPRRTRRAGPTPPSR